MIELHKDEEIHILVGQSGENACIRSMGMQDAACSAIFGEGEAKRRGQNIRRVNEMFIEYGGGGTWNELWHLHAVLLKFLMLYFSLSLHFLDFVCSFNLGGGGASYVFLVSEVKTL